MSLRIRSISYISLVFLLGISSVFTSGLLAQYTDLYYEQFGIEEGLPTNSVYAVGQDSKGYIWIGAQAGLARYDGYEFFTFTSENGLIQNEVVSLEIDSKDRVWLNTTGPLCYVQEDSVYYLDHLRSPNIAWNFHMQEDVDGNLWFSYLSEIYQLSGSDFSILKSFDLQSDGGHILGKAGNKFLIYNGMDIIAFASGAEPDTIILDDGFSANSFRKNNSDLLWPDLIYSEKNDLIAYDLNTGNKKKLIEDNFTSIGFHINGNYLISNNGPGGLVLYELGDSLELSEPIRLFEDNTVGSSRFDSKKNLWIPTYKSGLLFIRPISKKIITNHSLVTSMRKPLESVTVDGSGTVWMGTESGLLNAYSENNLKSYQLLKSSNPICRILDIDPYGDSDALITSDQGAYLFEDNKFRLVYNSACKNADYRDGNFIISSYSNVFTVSLSDLKQLDKSWNTRTINLDERASILNRSRSYASSFGRMGELWFASEENGLIKNEEGRNYEFGSVSNKLRSSIRDIVTMQDAKIAVASAGEGILIITEDNHLSISTSEGLSSNIVHCLEYKNDRLYAGSNKGLNIIEFGDEVEQFTIEVIDGSNGLDTDEINDISIYNDTLYLATYDGLLMIDDRYEVEKVNDKNPYIQIDEVLVNDEPFTNLNELEFGPHQNNVIIRYTAVDAGESSKLKYAYKLLGVDEEFIYTQSRETHYSNLSAGKYKFEVGVVSDNNIVSSVKEIEFGIDQEFVKSNLFKFIIGLLSFSILGFFLYTYNTILQKSRLTKLVTQRTKELDEKMNALEEANLKMEKSNEALQNYAHITSHDLKSPLRNVGSFVQLLAMKNKDRFDEKDKEYLAFAREGVKSMENTIDDLLVYSSLEKDEPSRPVPLLDVINQAIADLAVVIAEKSVTVSIEGEFPVVDGHFSRFKRLIQNLVENGIKYNTSRKPVITIHGKENTEEYQISIKDNGIGLDTKYADKIFEMFQRLHDKTSYSGTGIGLAMCKKIIESYGGRIWVDSKPGSGSNFYFTYPK